MRERGGEEGETIYDGRSCAGVRGVLRGGDGDMDRNRISRFNSGRITYATFGTGVWSLHCAGYHRGMPTFVSYRR